MTEHDRECLAARLCTCMGSKPNLAIVPEPVECCASGRCEVCTPGYDWGWDG